MCGTADGLEHLRFDCFENEPHYHYIDHAAGTNIVVRIDELAVGDPVEFSLPASSTTCPTCSETAGSPSLADEVKGRMDEVHAAMTEVRALMLPRTRRRSLALLWREIRACSGAETI